MKKHELSEQEKERRIRIARNKYLRTWRKKNKEKYVETVEKFWLKQYELLVEENTDDELQEERKNDEH